jgi:hypothetical protein
MPVVVGMTNENMCNEDMQCIHTATKYLLLVLVQQGFEKENQSTQGRSTATNFQRAFLLSRCHQAEDVSASNARVVGTVCRESGLRQCRTSHAIDAWLPSSESGEDPPSRLPISSPQALLEPLLDEDGHRDCDNP